MPIDTSPTVMGNTFELWKRLGQTPRTLGEQGACVAPDGKIYLSQAKPGIGVSEDTWIHSYTNKGVRLYSMKLPGAGHGTTIAVYQPETIPYMVVSYNRIDATGATIGRSLCMIPFQARTVPWGDPTVRKLKIGSGAYSVPALHVGTDKLLLRESHAEGDTFRVLSWSSVLADVPVELARFGPIVTADRSFQGIAICGPRAYILYGHTNARAAHRLNKFDPYHVDVHTWEDGQLIERFDYQPDILSWDNTIATEPAGLQVVDNVGLVGGIKVDANDKRWIGLFLLAPMKKLLIDGRAYEPIDSVSVYWVNNARTTGAFSRHVYWVQHWLNAVLPGSHPIAEDGHWGKSTQALFDTYRRTVLKLSDADAKGPVGVMSLSKLNDHARSALAVREDK